MDSIQVSGNPFTRIRPAVWITALVWICAIGLAVVLGNEYGLFDRPSSEGQSVPEQIMAHQFAAIEALFVIALVMWMTRKRPKIDATAIGISRDDAMYVLRIGVVYGIIAILGGYALGTAMDTYAFSFHLPGTLIGTHSHNMVSQSQAIAWSLYNLIAWVIVPLWYVRKRFPGGRSFWRSNNLRADIILIGTVLAIESVVQIFALSDSLLGLSAKQVVLGMPLSFVIYLLGTGLPTMVFLQIVIVPRLLVVTNSFAISVVLGGVAYTLVHLPESWMTFTSPSQTLLSIIFLFFTYFFPGMVKVVMTLRTGNAWVHMWAYHAIAPHVIVDTALIVAIFAIR